MVINENVKWVIIEVVATGEELELFVAPATLRLEPGFLGQIVWYVFTPGWQLSEENGIVFVPIDGFEGHPAPDPDRPFCWSTAAANEHAGTFHYTIKAGRKGASTTLVSVDPVVENEAPPTAQFTKLSAVS